MKHHEGFIKPATVLVPLACRPPRFQAGAFHLPSPPAPPPPGPGQVTRTKSVKRRPLDGSACRILAPDFLAKGKTGKSSIFTRVGLVCPTCTTGHTARRVCIRSLITRPDQKFKCVVGELCTMSKVHGIGLMDGDEVMIQDLEHNFHHGWYIGSSFQGIYKKKILQKRQKRIKSDHN